MEHNHYAVIKALTLPHCEEGEHDHYLTDRDAAGQPIGKENAVYDGKKPCESKGPSYGPGQTVFLTASQAEPLIASGHLAAAGADVEHLIFAAEAERRGFVPA